MIQPFSFRHYFLIRRLQGKGMSLDLERSLTQPGSPLWAALTSWLPFYFPTLTDIYTYVIDGLEQEQRVSGFAQVRERLGRPEADVVYLAPSLSNEDVQAIWHRLLTYLCAQAGERGTQRLFASVPEGGREVEVFHQAGFAVYTREDIFRLDIALAEPRTCAQFDETALRRCQSRDSWGLRKLYKSVTPHLVRQAEGLVPRDWGLGLGNWLGWAGKEEYVLENDRGEINGYLQINEGRIGHWLKLSLHPRAQERVDELLDYGLSFLTAHHPLPVYCNVREYEGGVKGSLEARGFQFFGRRAIMVKHSTVRVKEPALKLVPALEKRAEATPTPYGRVSSRVPTRANGNPNKMNFEVI